MRLTLPRSLAILFVAAASLVFSGCSKDKTATDAKKEATDKKATAKAGDKAKAAPTKAAPKKAAPKPGIELVEISDAKFGYTIKVPKGHKVLQKDDMMGHTFSLLVGGGRELNIHLTTMEVKDLASLVRTATMMGQKTLTKKEELPGGGFIVIKAAQFGSQEIWVAKKAGAKNVTAKCSGPTAQVALVEKMCASLTVK